MAGRHNFSGRNMDAYIRAEAERKETLDRIEIEREDPNSDYYLNAFDMWRHMVKVQISNPAILAELDKTEFETHKAAAAAYRDAVITWQRRNL